ncbi:MAG: hypothetical protein HQL75_08040 [Magnetococcales bacterium]|nr:hypothetical protein [Magnetococcales bacterium]
MRNRKKWTTWIYLVIFMMIPGSILAKDTEVFLGSQSTEVTGLPNVLFIIDTSGSMDTNVTTQTTYDPATTYSGSCNTSRIYWTTSGSPPSCSTSQYFAASGNNCTTATTSLNSSGFFIDRIARWSTSSGGSWRTLSTSYRSATVECEDDNGIHGDGVDGSKLYAADGSYGPYNASSSRSITWSNESTYTLYSGNYLNWRWNAYSVTKTRLEIVQEVFGNLMDSTSNIRAAVMRFNTNDTSSHSGGYFILPMQNLTDTNRLSYKTTVNALTPDGYTPLAETLYEAARFFRGEGVVYGTANAPGSNCSGVSSDATYISPIQTNCQGNYIVLLTDGEPTNDTSADSSIKALPDFSSITGSSTCSGNCLDELADYLYNSDSSSTLSGTQKVVTYTIGFTTDQTLLSAAATKGGGKYYTTGDTAGLTDAFTSILAEISAVTTSFVAPSLTVNQYNKLTHSNDVYFALFSPSSLPTWDGNLKRYVLSGSPSEVTDANGVAAVDATTGAFKDTAQSIWSSVVDGNAVTTGGAIGEMTDTYLPSRKSYTYVGTTAPSNVPLSTTSINDYRLHEDNTLITEDLLGISGTVDPYGLSNYRTSLLQWARGVDTLDEDSDSSTTDARAHMGDPLHSRPLIVSYGTNNQVIYFGTNEGFLHAIDVDGDTAKSREAGAEIFSFIPKELITNLAIFYANSGSSEHPDGLDGSVTVWSHDADGDGTIETGDHVYLYVGMRRGGQYYYALDVTDPDAPVLLWRIDGTDTSGDFAELGQTWSRPILSKIKLNGVDTQILIFGGGYDTSQDDNTLFQTDSEGRAVYIVNATTGERIWWAAGSDYLGSADLLLSDMTNCIPGDIKVVDLDSDGYADRMYFGDTGGQLWRLDIDQANTGTSSLVSGGRIASLGDADTVTESMTSANNRRFFTTPDIVKTTCHDTTGYQVSIGSGYRSHPLNETIQDRFYSFRDDNISGETFTILTESNLYDATDNLLGVGDAAAKSTALTARIAASGWMLQLKDPTSGYVGEKVLSDAVVFDNMLMFTTYLPSTYVEGSCSPQQGSGIFYLIDLCDATALIDFSTSELLDSATQEGATTDHRKTTLNRPGLQPEPSIVMPEGSNPIVLVGPEKPISALPFSNPVVRTFWTDCSTTSGLCGY